MREAAIIIRDDEGADPAFAGPWDTVFSAPAVKGDWAIADPVLEPNNAGGFQARDELSTAIFLLLSSDLRRPDWMAGTDAAGPRGWCGDYFDIDETQGERPMGSLLWTLRRAAINQETMRLAQVYVRDALQTLIDQHKIAALEVNIEPVNTQARLNIEVRAFNATGLNVFANTFPLSQGGA